MLKKDFAMIHRNIVFVIALLAAIITSFFHQPSIKSIDFKVIFILFSLMLIVKALDQEGLLFLISAKILKHTKTQRTFFVFICLLSFVFSMFLTDDVTILTLLPIIFAASKEGGINPKSPSIFVSIFAVFGSAVTPFGSTQNLSIYSHYNLNVSNFFQYTFPFLVLGVLMILLSSFLIPKQEHIISESVQEKNVRKIPILILLTLALMVILSVFQVIPYYIMAPIVMVAVLLIKPSAFTRVHYQILFILILFFIAVGNLSAIPVVKHTISTLVKTPKQTFFSSIILSQISSNVPATLLLEPFTQNVKALLYGINIAGFGTLISSFANLIAYNQYIIKYPDEKKSFFLSFSLTHLAFLLILTVIFYFLI